MHRFAFYAETAEPDGRSVCQADDRCQDLHGIRERFPFQSGGPCLAGKRLADRISGAGNGGKRREVFKFAARMVPKSINKVLDEAGVSKEEMLEKIRKMQDIWYIEEL